MKENWNVEIEIEIEFKINRYIFVYFIELILNFEFISKKLYKKLSKSYEISIYFKKRESIEIYFLIIYFFIF